MVNSIGWTGFGKAHTSLYKVPQLTVHVSAKKQAMRSKELFTELRDRIVSRNRSGEGYQQVSTALKAPKNTVASIILKWKKFGTSKTLFRACPPGQTEQSGQGLGQGGDQEPDGHSDRALEFPCGDGRTFQKVKSCLYGRVARWKPLLSKRQMTSRLEFARFSGLMKPRLNSLA